MARAVLTQKSGVFRPLNSVLKCSGGQSASLDLTEMRADLAAGRDGERLHACPGVVALLLAEPWVQHINDAFDGERGFCNVCRHNHLSERTESASDQLTRHLGKFNAMRNSVQRPGDEVRQVWSGSQRGIPKK